MAGAVPKVELIYEKTCPNINPARDLLTRALNESGLTPHWQEWEVNDPDAPDYVRDYGSPTILVNGKDVAEEQPSETSACCRIYPTSDANSNKGVPLLEAVIKSLKTF
jgi:mercuric ion transport protein